MYQKINKKGQLQICSWKSVVEKNRFVSNQDISQSAKLDVQMFTVFKDS